MLIRRDVDTPLLPAHAARNLNDAPPLLTDADGVAGRPDAHHGVGHVPEQVGQVRAKARGRAQRPLQRYHQSSLQSRVRGKECQFFQVQILIFISQDVNMFWFKILKKKNESIVLVGNLNLERI